MPKHSTPPQPINLADPPPLATKGEACATLRISTATLDRWIKSGRLEIVKIGHSVRIKVASIAALAV